jgi:16S rRNA (uracil1498-N3)-methyltransferase
MRHTFFSPEIPADSPELVITGDEAAHAAKSKRLREGDDARVIDGQGTVALTTVVGSRKSTLTLAITERWTEPPTRPQVHVFGATPKGQRLDKMLDMLAQAGAASWRPLETKLGVVEPGANKLDRAQRIAIESAKQCGRAHLMTVAPTITWRDALHPEDDTLRDAPLVLARQDGAAQPPDILRNAPAVRLLIGPEGGFTPEELDDADRAGATRVCLGPHVLRIETASVLGVGWVMGLPRTRLPEDIAPGTPTDSQ